MWWSDGGCGEKYGEDRGEVTVRGMVSEAREVW